MPSFVIGTAGHVDHGKTTLVRALTGVDTDRLPEEKRRGISIELGFAPWRVADGVFATVIDVPGHHRLVHTMIAGASGIELVLLVIAADEGVMPQTREHARVCEELGIREATVVLTKTDLVDAETVALAEAEARELLDGRFAIDVVPCSAANGEGVALLRDRVAARLRTLSRTSASGPARLWVDRVLQIHGAGTVVTGTLVSGSVVRGDDLVLFGTGGARPVTVRGLRVHDAAVDRAEAPTRLAVNLPVSAEDVRRGDLLTAESTLAPTKLFEAALRGAPPRRGSVHSLHAGSMRVPARVIRVEALRDGETLARLVLGAPKALSGGDRFLLRGRSGEDGSLLRGGTVLDASPHARSRGEARRLLARAVREGDVDAVLTSLLREVSPHALALSRVQRRLAVDLGALAGAAKAQSAGGTLVAVGEAVLPRATLTELADLARALVHEYARARPLERGLPLATLQAKLRARAGTLAADAALLSARARRSASDDGAIEVLADVVVPAGRDRKVDPELARLLELARGEVERAGVRGISAARLRETMGAPIEQVWGALAALERAGSAVRAGDAWFAASAVASVRAMLVAHLTTAGRVTVSELKELAGLPRNQAVLLLEHFDQTNVTRRVGDVRVLSRPS